MRTLKYLVQHWEKSNDGILYFFQRLQEMLFHYSDDIVRAPIHNTRTLIDEFLENKKGELNGQIKSYQIEQIVNELCYCVQHDKILMAKFGEEFIDTIATNIKSNTKDTIIYLKNKFPEKTYYRWCIEYLKLHAQQCNHKDEIEFATRAWIAEVISRGYKPEYIYNYINSKLSETISDANNFLCDFLENFSFVSNEFRVYLIFTHSFKQYKDILKDRLSIEFEDDGSFNKIELRKKDFIGYINIKSLDRYNAVYSAVNKVSIFIKYYQVFTNRRNAFIRPLAFTKKIEENKIYQIPIKSFGYRSYEPEPTTNIKPTINKVISNFQTKPIATYTQINKIIDLHNEAIQQQDLNDGFLNLWSILEIVSSGITSASKIGKVIIGIVPILQKDYFASVFENIDQDLHDNLTKKDYEELIKKTELNGNRNTYLKRFIFLPEFEKLREEYFEKLCFFPVIRMKIYRLWKKKDSKSQLINLAQKYAQRVTWHIYRLYRTRNAIVHSGDSHLQIQSLGEHLHIYVDQILMEILVKLTSERTLKSISDVLIDTKFSLSKINKHFNDNTSITDDDLEILCNSFFYISKHNE